MPVSFFPESNLDIEMDRPSPSHLGGMSPHSSSASLTSFLAPGQGPGNSPNAAGIASGIMSMSLIGAAGGSGQPQFVGGSPQQQTASPSTGPGHNTSSMAIRHEIQRFESVHPSIYAIYDLIELVPDPLLAQQIREHVVCIEGRHLLQVTSATTFPDLFSSINIFL